MTFVFLALALIAACFGYVMIRIGVNALAAAEQRHSDDQHEHVHGGWQ
ncbi:hypothetical protein [Kaistia sp. MMO-174]